MLGTELEFRHSLSSDNVERVRDILGENLPLRSLFEKYRPQPEWFLRPNAINGIHGIGHITRVMVWQEILSRLVSVNRESIFDQEAVRWAAATHDTQRLDDDFDHKHGDRSAVWVRYALKNTVDEDTLSRISFINKWHVPGDHQAPCMPEELALLKDADGLDRVRCGDLDPGMLRHGTLSALLVLPAHDLFQLSYDRYLETDSDWFDSVMAAGISLNLIQD